MEASRGERRSELWLSLCGGPGTVERWNGGTHPHACIQLRINVLLSIRLIRLIRFLIGSKPVKTHRVGTVWSTIETNETDQTSSKPPQSSRRQRRGRLGNGVAFH